MRKRLKERELVNPKKKLMIKIIKLLEKICRWARYLDVAKIQICFNFTELKRNDFARNIINFIVGNYNFGEKLCCILN